MQQLESIAAAYESRVGQQLQEKQAAEEKNVYQALIEKEKNDFEKERMKVEKRRAMELSNAEYNKQMIERKHQQQEQERLKAIEMRRKLELDSLENSLKEKEKKETKKQQYIVLKQQLDQQLTVQHENKIKEKAYYNDSESFIKKVRYCCYILLTIVSISLHVWCMMI